MMWMDFNPLRVTSRVGSCVYNEFSKKGRIFLDQLCDYQVLMKTMLHGFSLCKTFYYSLILQVIKPE
jgi:hypothetical protein